MKLTGNRTIFRGIETIKISTKFNELLLKTTEMIEFFIQKILSSWKFLVKNLNFDKNYRI